MTLQRSVSGSVLNACVYGDFVKSAPRIYEIFPENLVGKAQLGEWEEEIFVLACRAIIGADVWFFEVALYPCEVWINKETAVD